MVNVGIKELENRKQQYHDQQQELRNLSYYQTVARELFERGDLEGLRAYLEKISRIRPDDPVARDLAGKLEELQKKETEEKTADMVLIPAGKYQIGLDLPEAKFYNQQPQFAATLESFSMDREPSSLSGVSFKEAVDYCRSLGKRLATELEWEVATQQTGSGSSPTMSEWTASWYQAYPGNVIWEEEYGKKFRVLRSRENPLMRFYMAPGEGKLDVGFRCALDAEEKRH